MTSSRRVAFALGAEKSSLARLPLESQGRFPALRLVMIYAFFGALWILLSDRLLFQLVPDLQLAERLAIYKGWIFVAVTSVLLWLLAQRFLSQVRAAEEALHRLNRELRAISNCNEILLRATDEQSLLEEICRIAFEEGGYRMAFVAFAEHDESKSVRPVAWAGAEEGYLATVDITWADTERGRGLTGTAIRSGKTCCIQDFATDPRLAPWRESVLQHGFLSGIALPLKDEHANALGSLSIYSAQRNAFTSERIRLLEELAANLAFGIVTLRSRAARQRAEQELSLLSFALDKVRELAVLINDTGRLHYINEEGCRVLGYTHAELLGMGIPDIDPNFPAGHWPDHWRELKAQRSLSFESCLRTRDGRLFPVEVSANYFEYGDRAYNLALVRDITERKRAEEELRKHREHLEDLVKQRTEQLTDAKARAEAASRAKGAFLANMSHELRTPLNAIIGFSEVLQDQTFGPLNQKQSRYVDNVLTAGRHLLGLINDILDLSKVEAGKMKLEPSIVRVKAVLEDSLVLIKEKALKHGLGLSLEAPDDLTIAADERKLKQVIFNLLSNAAKFTPDGGRISVTAERADESVRISVADTGIGIKPEDQPRLFRKFEQIESSYARKHQGTGLGLSLTRELVELHGGRVWVESEGEGKGSTFRFVIPAEQPGVKVPAPQRIEWTPEFSVGVRLFDRQHQRLCGMINVLAEAQGTNLSADLLSRILGFMVDYAGEHFGDEERLMSQYGYPDLDQHVRQHRAFVAKTTELSTAAQQGDKAVPDKLLEYLREWLERHILGEDMKYKPFFVEKGVS